MARHQENTGPVSWLLAFGANNISNTAATRALGLGYNPGQAGTTAADVPVPFPCTATQINMSARVAGAAGAFMSGTIRKNGTPTSAMLITTSTATTGSITLSSPVAFNAGDLVGFEVAKSAGFTSPIDISYAVGFVS